MNGKSLATAGLAALGLLASLITAAVPATAIQLADDCDIASDPVRCATNCFGALRAISIEGTVEPVMTNYVLHKWGVFIETAEPVGNTHFYSMTGEHSEVTSCGPDGSGLPLSQCDAINMVGELGKLAEDFVQGTTTPDEFVVRAGLITSPCVAP